MPYQKVSVEPGKQSYTIKEKNFTLTMHKNFALRFKYFYIYTFNSENK